MKPIVPPRRDHPGRRQAVAGRGTVSRAEKREHLRPWSEGYGRSTAHVARTAARCTTSSRLCGPLPLTPSIRDAPPASRAPSAPLRDGLRPPWTPPPRREDGSGRGSGGGEGRVVGRAVRVLSPGVRRWPTCRPSLGLLAVLHLARRHRGRRHRGGPHHDGRPHHDRRRGPLRRRRRTTAPRSRSRKEDATTAPGRAATAPRRAPTTARPSGKRARA